MAKSGSKGKTKRFGAPLPEQYKVKVTSPGITPGMTDAEIKALAKARTRLYAESDVIRQIPRQTRGSDRVHKSGKKG